MRIIHIPPVKTPYSVLDQRMEMYLAHLVVKNPSQYRVNFLRDSYKIVDNSFNELQHAVDLDYILEAVQIVDGDEIILPDCLLPDKNIDLIQESVRQIECLDKYRRLRNSTKKMAVLHADNWKEAVRVLNVLDKPGNGIDVIGMPKGIPALAPFNKGRVLLSRLIRHKEVHFLGSIGLEEIVGSDVSRVRSMDSGWYLTHDMSPLSRREQIFSAIPLEEAEIAPDILRERAKQVNDLVRRWCF